MSGCNHTHAVAAAACRDTLRQYRTTLAAGGYEWLRPLSTREEVLQLHAKLDRVASMLQEQHSETQQQLQDQAAAADAAAACPPQLRR